MSHRTIRSAGWSTVVVAILFVPGCGSSPTHTGLNPNPSVVRPSCTFAYDERSLASCKHLALTQGDSNAALAVASYYDHPKRENRAEVVSWYERAADLGNAKALRQLFDAYSGGSIVPRNNRKAEEYLTKAADSGAEWAQLVVASRLEKSDPPKALALYLGVARRDNCHAQARLVRAFHKGDLTERNPTQAYFWSLLAASGDALKESESHQLAGLSESAGGYRANHPCILTRMKLHSLGVPESSLTPDFITLAQDAATNWRRGQQEPSLPAPPLKISSPSRRADSPSSESPRTEPPTGTTRSPAPSPAPQPTPAAPTPTAPPRVAARPPQAQMAPRPQWTPLPGATMLQSASGSRDLATLFATVSRSVWLVFAARSAADLEAGTGVAVGSAVAVSPRALLTKCHVVSGRPLVWIKQGETVVESTVVHGDSETDRCILSAPKATLQPVPGMRRYADLKVGESVYTIGSPRGLERSLGHGIISGLRQPERHLLIQTTAQISPGSSGGGLFDQFGNLLGITTFRLKDSEGLNFAIAVDEYFRP